MARSTRRRGKKQAPPDEEEPAAATGTGEEAPAAAAAPPRRSRRRRKAAEEDGGEEEKSPASSQVNTEEEEENDNDNEDDDDDDDGSSSRASKRSTRSGSISGSRAPPKKKARAGGASSSSKKQPPPPRRTTRQRRAVERETAASAPPREEDDDPAVAPPEDDDDDDDDVPLDKLVARRKKDGGNDDDGSSSRQTAGGGGSRRSRRGSIQSAATTASSGSGRSKQRRRQQPAGGGGGGDDDDDDDDDDVDGQQPPPRKKKRRKSLGEDSTIGSVDTTELLLEEEEDDDGDDNKSQPQHPAEGGAAAATQPDRRPRSPRPTAAARALPPPTVRTSNRRRNNSRAAAAASHGDGKGDDDDDDDDKANVDNQEGAQDKDKDSAVKNSEFSVKSSDEAKKKEDQGDKADTTSNVKKEKHGAEDDGDKTKKVEAIESGDKAEKKDAADNNAVKDNEKDDKKTEKPNTNEAESSGKPDDPEPKSVDGDVEEKGDTSVEEGGRDNKKPAAVDNDNDESKEKNDTAVEEDQVVGDDKMTKKAPAKDPNNGKPNDPEPSKIVDDREQPQLNSSDNTNKQDASDPKRGEQPTAVADSETEAARSKDAEGGESKNDQTGDAAPASKPKQGESSDDQKGSVTAGGATLKQQSADEKPSQGSGGGDNEPQLDTTIASGKVDDHPNEEDKFLDAVQVIPPPAARQGDKSDARDVAHSQPPPKESPSNECADGKVASQEATAVAATRQENAVDKAAAADVVRAVDKAPGVEKSKKTDVDIIAAGADPTEAGAAQDKKLLDKKTTSSSLAAETKEKSLDAAHTESRTDRNFAAEGNDNKVLKGDVETMLDPSVEVDQVAPASKPIPKKANPPLESTETTKERTVPQPDVVDLTEEEGKQEPAGDPMDIDKPAVPSKKEASSIATATSGRAADISIKVDGVAKDTTKEPTAPAVVVPEASTLDDPMDVDTVERGASSKILVAASTSTKETTAVECTWTSAETRNESPQASQNEPIATTAPLDSAAAAETPLDQTRRLESTKKKASDAARIETEGMSTNVQRHESGSASTEKLPELTSEKSATKAPTGGEKIEAASKLFDKAESDSAEKIASTVGQAKGEHPGQTPATEALLHEQPVQGLPSSNTSEMAEQSPLSSKAPAPMEEQCVTGVAENSALGNTDATSTTTKSCMGEVPDVAPNKSIEIDATTIVAGSEKRGSTLRSGDAAGTAHGVHVDKQPKEQPATATAVTIETGEAIPISHASLPSGSTPASKVDAAVGRKDKVAAKSHVGSDDLQPSVLVAAAEGQTKDNATVEVHPSSNAEEKPNSKAARKFSPGKDSVIDKTSLQDSADFVEVENLRIPTLPSEKQPVVQDTRVNLERIKVMIYSAGSRAHRTAGFERMFAAYWKALSMRLGGRLSDIESAKCQKVVDSFLKTRQMRKLHNKLILALLGRCIQPTAPLREISGFIPEQLRSRINIIPKPSPKSPLEVAKNAKKEIAQKEKDTQNESLAYNPIILENVPKPAASHEPPLSSASSMRIPGALVVDPRVRKIADAAGMKTSENAIWLLVIALKEFTMKVLDDTIATCKAVETDSVPSWPSIRPRILPKKPVKAPSHPKQPKRDEKPATKCITPFDIHTTTVTIPSGYKSLGGCLSRSTFERSLFSSFDNSFVVGGSAFHEVKQFVVSSVTPREPDLKRTKTEAPTTPVPAPAQPSPSTPKQTKANEQKQKSPVSKGLGRGAKDLASLKARSSFSPTAGSSATAPAAEGPVATTEMDKSRIIGGAAAVPQAPRVVGPAAPPATLVASAASGIVGPATHVAPVSGPPTQTVVAGSATQPASAPDPPQAQNESEKDSTGSQNAITPRRGKGFGVKNLAAMRARSLTSNSEDAAQAVKAASASDDVKETAKPMAPAPAAPVQMPVLPAGPSTTPPPPPPSTTTTTKRAQRTNPSPPAGSKQPETPRESPTFRKTAAVTAKSGQRNQQTSGKQPEALRESPTLPKNAAVTAMPGQHYQQTSGKQPEAPNLPKNAPVTAMPGQHYQQTSGKRPEAPREAPTLPKNAPVTAMPGQHYQQTSGIRHNLGPPFAGQNSQVPRQPIQNPAVAMANAQLAQGLANALMHNNGQVHSTGFSGPRPNMIPYPGQTPQGLSLGQLAQMVPGMQQGGPFGQLPHGPAAPLQNPQQQVGSSRTAQNAQAMAFAQAFAQNMAHAAAANQGASSANAANAQAGQTAMGTQNQNFSARSPARSTAGSERSSQSQRTGAAAPPASAGPPQHQKQQQQQGGPNEQKKK